jgi:UDPglucose 6-dehydrogenase
MKRLGHTIFYKDLLYGQVTSDADFYYICTPENAVEDVIKYLLNDWGLDESQPIVIKSTITPNLYRRIEETYDHHIMINPEFLREKESLWMSLNPNYIIIGECCKFHGDQLEQLFKPFHCPIARVDLLTAIFAKLASNAYLSTAISFWNELWLIAKKDCISTYNIGKTVSLEPRIPTHGATMHGMAYSGHCLPKDMIQLIEYAESVGVEPILLKAVEQVNAKIKTLQSKNS